MLNDKVSKRIRELRLIKNLTQEQLADKADIDLSYLGKIERGQQHNISVEILDKLIQALEIDYDDFFSFTDSENEFKKIQHDVSISKNKEDILNLIKGIVKLDKKK